MNQNTFQSSAPGSTDPLEEFVTQHRAEFDDVRAPRSMWAAISADLGPEPAALSANLSERSDAQIKRLPADPELTSTQTAATVRPLASRVVELYPLWRKLAVACMLLTIGVLAGMLVSDRLDRRSGAETASVPGSRPAQVERGYRVQLEARLAQVEALSPDSALRAELVSIAQPDYRTEADFGTLAPANERLVIETMALEYQAKLEVVEHILARLRAAEEVGRVRQEREQLAPEPTPQQL